MAATKNQEDLVTEMIENVIMCVVLHEVLIADHYEPSEVHMIIEMFVLFSSFSAWSGNDKVKETIKLCLLFTLS